MKSKSKISLKVRLSHANYIAHVACTVEADDGKSDLHDPNTKTHMRINAQCLEGEYNYMHPLKLRVLTIRNNKLWWTYFNKEYKATNGVKVLKAIKDAL